MKALAMLIITVFPAFGADRVLMPQLDGEWWQVAGDPDLGKYSNPKQQPVDFAIWQAADGSWQIWSCIRGTNCGGKTRLFYRWQGSAITDRERQPMGIAMEADPAFGETSRRAASPSCFENRRRVLHVLQRFTRVQDRSYSERMYPLVMN
jgi:hypothetical protein